MKFKVGDRAVIPEQDRSVFPGKKIPAQAGRITKMIIENDGIIYAEMQLDNGVRIMSAPVELLERGRA